jgi:hypothetical protein
LVEGVRTISPTVCTAVNSQKPALGPTHPFESYHTSRLQNPLKMVANGRIRCALLPHART